MRAEKPFIADISIIQPTKEQWQVIFNLFIENKVLSYGEFLFLESAQWVAHGFDSSKINWDAVGQAAIGGAVGGVLGSGGGIWQTGNNAGLLETVGVNVGNQVTEGLVSSLVMGENYHMTEFGRDLGLGSLQGVHYYRNELNVGLPENLETARNQNFKVDGGNLLHGPGNTKMIQTKDFNTPLPFTRKSLTIRGWGREAVYNGAKDTSSLVRVAGKMGTYNYFRSNIPHVVVDVAPWLMWGNTKQTTFLDAF